MVGRLDTCDVFSPQPNRAITLLLGFLSYGHQIEGHSVSLAPLELEQQPGSRIRIVVSDNPWSQASALSLPHYGTGDLS